MHTSQSLALTPSSTIVHTTGMMLAPFAILTARFREREPFQLKAFGSEFGELGFIVDNERQGKLYANTTFGAYAYNSFIDPILYTTASMATGHVMLRFDNGHLRVSGTVIFHNERISPGRFLHQYARPDITGTPLRLSQLFNHLLQQRSSNTPHLSPLWPRDLLLRSPLSHERTNDALTQPMTHDRTTRRDR